MAKVLIGNFKGPKGDKGDKGDPGTAATIQVGTTQTVQPEENAEVTNSGTANAAVLNFKIPRGEDGMTDLTAEYKDASEYTCQPTVNAPVVVKELDGKTEQVETTGVQLFDASKLATASAGGATVTNNGDGSFTISGSGNLTRDFYNSFVISHDDFIKMFKKSVLYLKSNSEEITVPYIYTIIQNSSGKLKEFSLSGKTIDSIDISQYMDDETVYAIIGFYSAANTIIKTGTIKPMLYQDGDGTWEPYTGGSPAPSPDYLQAIKGVGGMGYFDGEWIQGYYGKDGVYQNNTSYVSSNKIYCNPGDSIAVKYEKVAASMLIYFFNESGGFISFLSPSSTNKISADAPANTKYFIATVNDAGITPSTAKYCTVTINGEYQTGVESRTAQLFDASRIQTKSQGGATVTNNGDGSFTVSGSGNLSENFKVNYKYSHLDSIKILSNKAGLINIKFEKTTYPYCYMLFNADGYLGEVDNASSGATKFEITEEMLNNENFYIEIGFNGTINSTIVPGTIKPMLYQDGDGTWQPYHHTALSIPLTSPLYEGDKICYVKPGESYVDADGDTVTADRVLYGCYRENAEVVFDGSGDEAWEIYASEQYSGFRIEIEDMKENSYNDGFSNLFPVQKSPINDPGIWLGSTSASAFSNYMQVHNVNPTYATDVSGWKTWLQSHNMTVVYPIATPYFEPFADQAPFYSLRTDDTLSYVYSNDPIEPNVTVEVAKNSTGGYLLESYAQAQKNAIAEANSQSRLSAIEQQLVNQATTPTE